MDERGPRLPLRTTPTKDPLDRSVAAGSKAGAEAASGVEVVATAEDARRLEDAIEEAHGADLSGQREEISGAARPEGRFSGSVESVAEGVDKVVRMLHDAAARLEGEQQQGVARMLHEGADGLEQLVSVLREQDAAALVEQARDYARQRPVFAVGGAFAIGFLLGRMFAPRRPHD